MKGFYYACATCNPTISYSNDVSDFPFDFQYDH